MSTSAAEVYAVRRGGDDAWIEAARACPKSMQHGPCAGVAADGACEVPAAGPCPFVSLDTVSWPYPVSADVVSGRNAPVGPPLVVADLPAAAMSTESIISAARVLTGRVDAVLLGDNALNRVQFPPAYRVRVLTDAGLPAWAGLNCRDRTRVALEGEIAACVDAGAVGLHCVTGDHPGRDGHSGAAIFELDSLDLVMLAADRGVPCSVAHAPTAPPREIRLPRLLAKITAGADSVFVDHCGGAAQVADATAQLRAAGFAGTVLACVPIVVDVDSARVLESFAADTAPPGYIAAIMTATDPMSAGIAAAIEMGQQLLAIPGMDGVNLSGGTRPGHEAGTAAALGEIADALHAVRPGHVPTPAAVSA